MKKVRGSQQRFVVSEEGEGKSAEVCSQWVRWG